MNAESDEFIGFVFIDARGMDVADELRRNAVDSEGDDLVSIEAVDAGGFDLTDEFETDVVDGVGEEIVIGDVWEAEFAHFSAVLRIAVKGE